MMCVEHYEGQYFTTYMLHVCDGSDNKLKILVIVKKREYTLMRHDILDCVIIYVIDMKPKLKNCVGETPMTEWLLEAPLATIT